MAQEEAAYQDEQSQKRFTPTRGAKVDKSSTKRIAIFIFVAAGALFTLVALAIVSSGDNIMSSRAPDEIIEASRSASVIIPPPPRQPEPEPEPTPAPVDNGPQQPAAAPQAEPQPPAAVSPARPAYAPAPAPVVRLSSVTERQRQNQTQRIQAAAAPTAIDGFGKQSGSQGAASLLSGATGTFDSNPAAEAQQNAANSMALMQQGMPGADSDSDPNGWARKEAFRNKALPAEYSQHTRAFAVSALELKAGAVLPCVLISGLNSDLPGNLIGQVSENVWDTATGRHLLIPRGSRVIGSYDHQISYGQNRALVIWSRLIFPDGSSLLLDNLQGADQRGYTGFKQRVDKHWGEMITSALLVSLLGAGVELAAPNNNNNFNNNSNRKDVGGILSERVATAIAEAMTQIISKGMRRQPTITIRPGYRFTIFVQHDIVFPRVWNPALGR